MSRFDLFLRARRDESRRRRTRHLILAVWLTCVMGALAGIPFAAKGVSLTGDLIARFRPTKGGIETTESAASMMRFRAAMFESRPSPTPTPTEEAEVVEEEAAVVAYVPPAGSISEIIYAAAAEFGVDGAWLVSIASCESGLNPSATNPAGYYGLFQFDEGTWASYGYGSIYDATAQARTAARLIAAGQASRWPSCA